MKDLTLSARLTAIAALVRENARLSDVGTDHGYLPAYLLYNGKISFAVASDIAKGPLSKAERLFSDYSLSERSATTVLTPGLRGIEEYAPTDIVIAGMGGELIASILEDAPFVKDEHIRLILQPMTKWDVLHRYLAENGFELLGETAVEEEEKIYRILCCRYTGNVRRLSDIEAEFSEKLFQNPPKTVGKLLFARKKQLEYIIQEKKRATADTGKEESLLAELKKIISDYIKQED